jgi:protein O-mannosyl-transferase
VPSEAATYPTHPGRPAQKLSPPIFLALAVGCLAAVAVAYLPSLDYQFILDDHSFITHPTIQESGHVWDYFTTSTWSQFTGGPSSFYRPIFLLWLRINFMLSGLSTWGWHLLSIVKHLVAAILLAALVWKLLRDSTAALIAAILFALHPAQTESVSWVTVPDPLMTSGVLVALLCYLKYSECALSGENAKSSRAKKSGKGASTSTVPLRWRWLAASVAAYFLALLAKETAIVVPLVILAMNLAPAANPALPQGRSKRSRNNRSQWLYALRQTVPFLAITGIYFLLRESALGNMLGARTQHLPWSTVVLSWPSILCFYLKVLFWPVKSYAFANPILVEDFSARELLLPLAVLACVAAVVTALLVWTRKNAQRERGGQSVRGIENALIIGTLLLVLPLLPALNLNALNPGDFLHGRYAYLSVAGLMLLLSTALHVVVRSRLLPVALACALAVSFAVLTFGQEKQWKDDATIFTVAHALAPHNLPVARHLADTHVQAALQLGEQGRCAEALPIFDQVISDFPDDWFAWAGRGDCYFQIDDLPKAEESLHRASDLAHNPQVTEHWQELRAYMGLPNSTQ